MSRKLTMLTVNRRVGMCPPSDWQTAFVWVEYRDGRPVYSDACEQVQASRPDLCVERDQRHILWAEERDR